MIRQPPRSTLSSSSAASDVYKRQVPFGILACFGIVRLRQIADYPCVIMPRSVLQSVRMVASCALIAVHAVLIITKAAVVHDEQGSYVLASRCLTTMGWLFATMIMVKEHSRALNQSLVLRAWWVLQLTIGSVELHATIESKQVGVLGLIGFVVLYTLVLVLGVLACVQPGAVPRYSPVPCASSSHELGASGLPPRASPARPWLNWNGTVSCTPRAAYVPESLPELQTVIRHAARSGLQLRVRGSGSSSSQSWCTEGVLVSLERLNKVIYVDKRHSTVQVQAGVLMGSLCNVLSEFGMALPSLPPLSSQSLGGVVALGSHGSGLKHGCISDALVGLDLLNAEGELVRVSTEHNPEMMNAARVSLGCLGVIYSVTLQCEPVFNLRCEERITELEEVMLSCDDLIQHNDHVQLEWFPFTTAVLVRLLNRTQAPVSAPSGCLTSYACFLRHHVLDWVCALGALSPRMVPSLWHLYARKLLRLLPGSVAASHLQLMKNPVRRPSLLFLEMEYAVALPDARAAVAELRRYTEQQALQGYYLSLPVSLRFAAMDLAYCSPAYMRSSCYMTVRAPIHNPGSHGFLAGLGELWHRFGGRPNLGCLYYVHGPKLRLSYPELDRFCDVRDKLDPGRMFSNEHIEDLLGPLERAQPGFVSHGYDEDMDKYEI
eukprot:TRINITY_DN27811_c0_g1_i2.p1 TRINITY_DN27811_c0_g1~~TRINITY_DN27811_c0_g1_i2.p1  ORF type:complete len:661 (+),score=202.29 TRINITY_DN27811_c0_g1_i2:93-2075(+)